MAVRWSWWWSTLALLAAVVLPGATSARPDLPPAAHAVEARAVPDVTGFAPLASPLDSIEARFLQASFVVQPPPSATLFDRVQVVSLYGYPNIPSMGDLGSHSAEEAATLVTRMAESYDALNGSRGAIG